MPSPNIIDFQAARLRALHKMVSQNSVHQELQLPADNPQRTLTGSDDAALVIRLVLELSRQNGRDYNTLPQLLRVALDDLCSDGNAACRLVQAWLLGEPLVDQPPAKSESSTKLGDRVFRHGRFWRPGSPWLLKADERRRAKLISLLSGVEDGE